MLIIRSDAFYAISQMFATKTYLHLNKKTAQLLWNCITSSILNASICFSYLMPEDSKFTPTWREVLTHQSLTIYFEQCSKLIDSGLRNFLEISSNCRYSQLFRYWLYSYHFLFTFSLFCRFES